MSFRAAVIPFVLLLAACGLPPVDLAGAAIALDSGALVLASATTDGGACPSAVSVRAIPPVAGHGYAWVQATYADSPAAAEPPTWSAPEGVDILPYPQDPFIAYLRGPEGTHVVRATSACPETYGEAKVKYTPAEP